VFRERLRRLPDMEPLKHGVRPPQGVIGDDPSVAAQWNPLLWKKREGWFGSVQFVTRSVRINEPLANISGKHSAIEPQVCVRHEALGVRKLAENRNKC